MAAEHAEHLGLRDVAGVAVPDRPDAARSCPVVTAGSGYFEGEGRPHVVRMELPLSASEMVAALYGEHERLMPADLEADGDVWGQIAMVVVQDGLPVIWQLAGLIGAQERCHALAAPGWLALCRRRVAEVTAGEVCRSPGLGQAREGARVAAWVKGGDSRAAGQ
jgi:hypothetical protein